MNDKIILKVQNLLELAYDAPMMKKGSQRSHGPEVDGKTQFSHE